MRRMVQKPAGGGSFAMGLGWMIAGDGSTRWHNGQTGGYQSMILVSRKLKLATVLLCNTAGSETDQLAEQIFQSAAGMNVTPRDFTNRVVVKPEVVSRLTGNYELTPQITIRVTANNGRIMAQLTGQQALSLQPKSDVLWRYQAVDAELRFELPEQGNATSVTLLQFGREIPAPRK